MTLVVACRLLVTDGIRFLSKPVSTEQNHSQVLAHSVTSLRLVLLMEVFYSAGWALFFLFRTLRRLSGIR